MIFNSFTYLLFLPTIVIIFYLLPVKYRKYLLLLGSYFFYAYWKIEYLSLILLSTITDYYCALQIQKTQKQQLRKIFLSISLFINLGLLILFKYYDFLFQSINSLMFNNHNSNNHILNLILPVGISFYTFQTIAYTIDVYRKNIKAEQNVIKFALYVSFFPQLVAGPIERAKNLLPQLSLSAKLSTNNITKGGRLILWGFFKKIVISDNIGLIVDQVYNNPTQQNAITYLLATLFFTFQIYCDFSGYSDIAIGSARILGVKLMTNFNLPYISKSFKEFWSRWHISLSSWFRDYLYIPLGGNRVSKFRTQINLFLVFLISGLWHGANWTFFIWGVIHAIFLIAENITHNKLRLKTPIFIRQIFVFTVVLISWIFFRANTVNQANTIIKLIFTETFSLTQQLLNGQSVFLGLGDITIKTTLYMLIGTIAFFIADYYRQKKSFLRHFAKKQWLRMTIYFILLYSILFLGYFGETNFIYFQF